MSLLAVGLSHRTAPVALLERVSVAGDALVKLLHDMRGDAHVTETMIVSTCNRVEVYAEVERFHGGVTAITELLSRHSGVPQEQLTRHLYVHYEDRVVEHIFTVVCGLDSMAVGEGQILGQMRRSLRLAQEQGTAGTTLNELAQQALRVGKRAHTETGIDGVGASLVGLGLTLAERVIGPIQGRRALVVGAGSMSALASVTLARAGITDIVIANRTFERAARLAHSVGGRAVQVTDIEGELAGADLVISCTGAGGVVIGTEMVARATRGKPLFLLDLALPHDVDPGVRTLPGVTLVDLESMRQAGFGGQGRDGDHVSGEVAAVRSIVATEVCEYLRAERAAKVTPTVVALRAKADDVVATEIGRLMTRVPEIDGRVRGEISQTIRRVVDKLLHEPTVRVKRLAASPAGDHYAEALRELFDLDPKVPEAVTRAEATEVETDATGRAGEGEP